MAGSSHVTFMKMLGFCVLNSMIQMRNSRQSEFLFEISIIQHSQKSKANVLTSVLLMTMTSDGYSDRMVQLIFVSL